MATSLFYKAKFSRLFDVPCLAFEHFGIKVSGIPEGDEEAVLQLYGEVLTDICGVEATQQNIAYFGERLKAAHEYASEQLSKKGGDGGKRSFASEFWKDVSKQSAESLLIQMANYDISKAQQMYCKLDRDDMLEMIDIYTSRVEQDQRIFYEACVYGFGGEMGESKKADQHDLSNGVSQEAASELKGLGF